MIVTIEDKDDDSDVDKDDVNSEDNDAEEENVDPYDDEGGGR